MESSSLSEATTLTGDTPDLPPSARWYREAIESWRPKEACQGFKLINIAHDAERENLVATIHVATFNVYVNEHQTLEIKTWVDEPYAGRMIDSHLKKYAHTYIHNILDYLLEFKSMFTGRGRLVATFGEIKWIS
jgi:hypothetical protein